MTGLTGKRWSRPVVSKPKLEARVSMDDVNVLRGPELDAAVTEEVLGIPKRSVPIDMAVKLDDPLGWYGGVRLNSELWREIVSGAIAARVILHHFGPSKAYTYAAQFDGWELRSYRAWDRVTDDDTIALAGTPEDWLTGAPLFISPAPPVPISSDWEAYGILVKRLGLLRFASALETTLATSGDCHRDGMNYHVRVRAAHNANGYGHSCDLREALGRAALEAMRNKVAADRDLGLKWPSED